MVFLAGKVLLQQANVVFILKCFAFFHFQVHKSGADDICYREKTEPVEIGVNPMCKCRLMVVV